MNTPAGAAAMVLFTWGMYSTNAPVPPTDQRIIQEVRGPRMETADRRGDNRQGKRR